MWLGDSTTQIVSRYFFIVIRKMEETKHIQLFPPPPTLPTSSTLFEGATNKVIVLVPTTTTTTKKAPPPPRPRTKRVITHTDRWHHVTDQQDDKLPEWLDGSNKEGEDDAKLVHRQILNKIAGYKSQDQHKHLYDADKFVTFHDVLTLLNSNMACYYCKDHVLVLYDYVREPRQWTLERLINDMGHNRDNVVVACLQCNLRRRTMLSSKYLQTQEMKHVTKV